MSDEWMNLELRSRLEADGTLRVSLETSLIRDVADHEVVVEVRAAPLNPSDLAVVVGPADPASARALMVDGWPAAELQVASGDMDALSLRIGQALGAGLEGSGIVVAAGRDDAARALLGRVVALGGGGMLARYRKASASECFALPEGVTPAQAASTSVNPMTALGMIETMRVEGHRALIHTAAASNLGQMLARLCVADGIDLVAVVRSADQAAILREIGVTFVCDTSDEGFDRSLADAVAATGATLAFDALSGGTLAGRLLRAMDVAASAKSAVYSTYGSAVHKQVYLYGGLNPGPIVIEQNVGRMWGVGGWHLRSFMERAGPKRLGELRTRVAAGLGTLFASRYAGTLSLAEVVRPDVIQAYMRRATGRKYLVDPAL